MRLNAMERHEFIIPTTRSVYIYFSIFSNIVTRVLYDKIRFDVNGFKNRGNRNKI